MIKKLLVLLLSLFLAASVFAQEGAKNKIVVLDDFSGGLATKLSSLSLPINQGDIYENIRLDDELKSITKRQQVLLYGTADSTEAITGGHRLYLKDGTKVLLVTHGDEIETGNDTTGAFTKILDLTTGDYRWQWTTWNNIAIGTDGYNQPVKYDGTSASATYLGSCLATDAGSGAGPDGTYHYKVNFYTTTYEVAFNVASNAIVIVDNDINLTMIPIAPDTYGGETVIGRKIYRHKTGASTYYLLSNGTIANNTATTLTDSDSDAQLSATTLPTTYTCTPPKGKLPIIHFKRLFLANNPTYPSRLYYSDDSSADYFLPTDYYQDIRPDDGDQITFIKTLLGILTVGKDNSIQKVYTDGVSPSTDWSISDVFSNIGCKAMYSAQITPVGIIYLGSDGLYKFNGQYSTLISDQVTPEIKDILESSKVNTWGQYGKNKYYLAYASKKTGESDNNRILIYNLLTNAYTIDLLNANCFVSFNSGTDWDSLYFGSSTDGKFYNYTYQTYDIFHHRHSDFGGTFTNARYIPTGVPGGDANDPIIEISRTGTINGLSGIINNLTGTIDRDSLTGSYISPALNLKASKYDKVYWNERFVSSGDDITLAIRSNSTEASLSGTSWSSEYSDPSGSDISALTANAWMQYRISLTTDAYTHSPELYDYLRIIYLKEASTVETSIAMRRRSGWLDFLPGYKKTLRKIQVYYTGNAGTLDIKFETSKGDTDTFDINMADHPDFYEEYFTGGALTDELFQIDITNTGLSPFTLKKIVLLLDLEPIQ